MSTIAQVGIGARLDRWRTVGTSGSWERVVEVTALSWDGITRNVIETFVLDNSDDYVNKLQGILNAGSITATINYSKDEFNTLKNDMETRGSRPYRIVLPDGEGIVFDGFITELPLDIGSDDVMAGDVAIEIDGSVDFQSTAPNNPN